MSVLQIISWCVIALNAILLIWNGVLIKRNFKLRELAVQNLNWSAEILKYSKQVSEKCELNEDLTNREE